MPRLASTPLSTYRLQFNKDFGFADATRLLDYFSELGITDLYASPILMSRRGSGHGYDVTDSTRLDPEIGSEEDFETLQSGLMKRGMGLLLDIVPNHMAACSENRWWMDVLENGAQSAFASYFDIEWEPPSRHLTGKVLLPILGQPFGDALDQGQIQLTFQEGRFLVSYFDSTLPIAPESYHQVLGLHFDLEGTARKQGAEFQELSGILAGFIALPTEPRANGAIATRPKFDALHERLRLLVSEHPVIAALIESNLKEFNGTPGNPASFRLLERLLSQQHYVLAYWQDPNEGINYRRFFAISDLVGVRVEDPVVFDATHDYILRILLRGASRGLRIGLRVDHVDGLRDPAGYLARLQQRLAEMQGALAPVPYIVVEKILAGGEQLPGDWPISGTTGYEYLNYLNGVFVEEEGFQQLKTIYSRFIGKKMEFSDVVFESKKRVMNSLLRVEVRGLARHLAELAAKDRYARNISRLELMEGLTEVTACMPVYRTYIRTLDAPAEAKTTIEQALNAAQEKRPHLSQACIDFLRDVLTLSSPDHIRPEQQEERLAFVTRWQQFTGPIFAKGFEDSSLYIYYPLCSLNEVGGNPETSRKNSREVFYDFIRERQDHWPHALNATMTHDAKRGEDVRARLNVLSEVPQQWRAKIAGWAKQNAPHKEMLNGREVPDANEEYLIYQTLVGMWPPGAPDAGPVTKRLQDYTIKAIREATVHTRWVHPDEQHERGVVRFIERILSQDTSKTFLADMVQFQSRLAWWGAINGLGQTLLKIVTPGTPDFYLGSEMWELRLVDPDNRTPVDFVKRCKALGGIADEAASPEGASELLRRWPDGCIKMHVARIALRYRRSHQKLFTEGAFLPVMAHGIRSQNVLSILRHSDQECAIAVVPRWLAGTHTEQETLPSQGYWGETSLLLPDFAPESWMNLLTGESFKSRPTDRATRSLDVHQVLGRFPVALLVPGLSVTPPSGPIE
jgi:(1->4)-alpha-D-glucan 1-alpha-D-glucosylmutase